MEQYYKCSVRIEFTDENGKIKKRREDYIVKSINPTEVEAKINEELSAEDFEILSISTTKIVDII